MYGSSGRLVGPKVMLNTGVGDNWADPVGFDDRCTSGDVIRLEVNDAMLIIARHTSLIDTKETCSRDIESITLKRHDPSNVKFCKETTAGMLSFQQLSRS